MNCFITNETFLNESESFKLVLPSESFFEWHFEGNDIVITCNYIAAPRIAYCYYKDKFIFDLGSKAITNFVSKYFPNDCFREAPFPYSTLRKGLRKDYEINHTDFIENWSKVIIHKDGTFRKIDYNLKVNTIPLKDSYELIHQTLIKYKKLVSKLLKENNFIPTVTGGIDTRNLICLWQDKIKEYNIDTIFLKNADCYTDNQTKWREANYDVAMKVANKLNIYKSINIQSKISLSGAFSERYLEGTDYIFKIIQHYFLADNEFTTKCLFPFIDDLIISINLTEFNVFKCLLAIILTPEDVTDIGYISSLKLFDKFEKKPYKLNQAFSAELYKAKEIIEYWGKEACNNILK